MEDSITKGAEELIILGDEMRPVAAGSVPGVNVDTLVSMSDETLGLLAGVLAVVAAWIVFAMVRAVAKGQLSRDSGFGLVTPTVKKTDATWSAGHEAALPVAKKTIAVTAGVWLVALVIGLIVQADWAGYLGLVPYVVVVGGFVPMVRAANAAAVEAAKKGSRGKKKRKR